MVGQMRPQMQGAVNPIEAIAMMLEQQDAQGGAPQMPVQNQDTAPSRAQMLLQGQPQQAPQMPGQDYAAALGSKQPGTVPPNQEFLKSQLKPHQAKMVESIMRNRNLTDLLGRGGSAEDFMSRDPVDFFRTEGKARADILSKRPTSGFGGMIFGNDPQDAAALDSYKTALDLIQKRAPGTAAVPSDMKTEGAQLRDTREEFLQRASTPAQAASPEDLLKPKPEDVLTEKGPGEDVETDELLGRMEGAAKAAQQKGNLKTPDQADEFFRAEFKEDPYIENALQEARLRYEQAKAESGKNPGILEYIGYALAVFAGAHPFQAAEMVSRRGEKFSREQTALNDLMQMQGAKIQEGRYNRSLAQNAANQNLEAMAMLQREGMRGQQRGEQQNIESVRSGRSAALQRLNMLMRSQSQALNAAEKQGYQQEINALKNRVRAFNQMLGEPDDAAVNRLLGID